MSLSLDVSRLAARRDKNGVSRMLVRQKRGRPVVASPSSAMAHGRLAPTAPASRVSTDLADPAERFAFALVERAVARRVGDARAKRSAKQRTDRARTALVALPNGLAEAQRIAHALASCGGAMLRTVERASVDAREFAARAAVRFVALVREHDAQSTAALVLLGSAAQWSAIGEMLRDRAFATTDDEARALALKSATTASSGARLDLLAGLELEARARSERAERDARKGWPFALAVEPEPEPVDDERRDEPAADDETRVSSDEPAEASQDDSPHDAEPDDAERVHEAPSVRVEPLRVEPPRLRPEQTHRIRDGAASYAAMLRAHGHGAAATVSEQHQPTKKG